MDVIDFPKNNRGAVAMFSEMLHRAEGQQLSKAIVIGMTEGDGNTFIASSNLNYLELMGLLTIALKHGD